MRRFIICKKDSETEKKVEVTPEFESEISEIFDTLSKGNGQSLCLKSIVDIFKEEIQFNIPSIQRGYRWKADEQVKILLDDILDIAEDEEVYCLQPIVVSRKCDNSNDEYVSRKKKYNLIDGQQRFTTLYLIFKALSNLQDKAQKTPECKISISYEVREDTANFLKEPGKPNDEAKNEYKNPDYYFLYKAYKKVCDYITHLNKENEVKFIGNLRKLHVIWYEIETKREGKVFSDLNSNKIGLCDSDLIKASLLQSLSSNGTSKSAECAENKNPIETEKEISRFLNEWEHIEQSLRKEDFWAFVYGSGKDYIEKNRIELLFDSLVGKKKNSGQFFTYNKFINEKHSFEEIKSLFNALNECYVNPTLYNLAGCLISIKGKDAINSIKERYSNTKTKKEFEEKLKLDLREKILPKVEGNISEKIDKISFSENKDYVKPLLLAFNIALIQGRKARFDFENYHHNNWDIEHINARNPPGKDEEKSYILEYLTGKYQNASKDSGDKFSEDDKKNLSEVEQRIYAYAKGEFNNEDDRRAYDELKNKIFAAGGDDNLGNLTLLLDKTNRSYGNVPFCFKRKIILNAYYEGSFIPHGTMAVFNKHFTGMRDGTIGLSWSEDDAKKYLEKIKNTISEYYFS